MIDKNMKKIENKHLINPFSLFGISYKSDLTELKKAYYSMSLICHPDKGGNKDEMIVILNAYRYVREQLENKTEKSYEDLENEFENFCNEQKNEKIPKFGEIYEETSDWIIEFNKEFERKNNFNDKLEIENNPYKKNPFDSDSGYGSFMDNEKVNTLDYNSNIDKTTNNDFKKQIIVYDEPHCHPDYIDDKFPLDKKKITDFSSKTMRDYMDAFNTQNELENVTNENINKDVMDTFEKELSRRGLS